MKQEKKQQVAINILAKELIKFLGSGSCLSELNRSKIRSLKFVMVKDNYLADYSRELDYALNTKQIMFRHLTIPNMGPMKVKNSEKFPELLSRL